MQRLVEKLIISFWYKPFNISIHIVLITPQVLKLRETDKTHVADRKVYLRDCANFIA
jgi:hypothetical protein